MTTQLSTDAPDHHGIEPIPLPINPPDGFWIREASHAPQPWTAFTREVAMAAIYGGTRRMYAEFGALGEALEFREIGGWEYARIVPLGDRQPPALPAWLLPLAFRFVPALRRRIRASVTAIQSDLPAALLRRWAQQWRPDLIARIAILREVDLASLDDARLDDHLGEALALTEHGLGVHFLLHGPIAIALAELAFTCRDLFGWDEVKVFELLGGTSHTSTGPARALATLAASLADRPALRRLLEAGAPARTVLATDERFAAEFNSYQREFGCRALSYEFADPCLDEQPDLALVLIRDQLATGFDHDATDEANRTARANARSEALRLLEGRSPAKRRQFDRALKRALLAYPIREDNEFFTTSAPIALTHRAAQEVGRRLTAAGLLDTADDAFHLTPARLRAALRERLDSRAQARTRIAERAWALVHPGPASYGPPPAPPPPLATLPPEARLVNEAMLWVFEHAFGAQAIAGHRRAPGPDTTELHGVAASAGTYTGPARIIHGEDEFHRLQAGDVLVCPATSPVWSVLFASIGALVADGGGMLSHQAIIAREYGLPAVVGTHDGTSQLLDGQTITVDGTGGVVRAHR